MRNLAYQVKILLQVNQADKQRNPSITCKPRKPAYTHKRSSKVTTMTTNTHPNRHANTKDIDFLLYSTAQQ
jgi:hypothetical protein